MYAFPLDLSARLRLAHLDALRVYDVHAAYSKPENECLEEYVKAFRAHMESTAQLVIASSAAA